MEQAMTSLLDLVAKVVTDSAIALEGYKCQTSGHQWVMIGGKNAGCSDDCRCSVPVHRCRVCGDYDYGQNEEAGETRLECARLISET